MPGLSDIFGSNGVLEQLLLWGVVNQVISTLGQPGFTALAQDVAAKHPNVVLSPDVLANAVARALIDKGAASGLANQSGTSDSNFDLLCTLAKVRLQPADLATAVLRSYVGRDDALEQVAPQGYDPAMFDVLVNLEGDAPGPEELAVALRRGIIERDGTGADSTSYEQGIAETRLHNKWGPVIYDLAKFILSPPDAASAVVRGFLPLADALAAAAANGVDEATFTTMTQLAADAPSPDQLAVALRRGIIPETGEGPDSTSFDTGIREGRLADKWIPMFKDLAQEWPTPADALNAVLKGQVDLDEGKALYERFGGDPTYFQLLFDTDGEAPTPLELIMMANRGYIPWDGTGPNVVSYQQGFKEGRWRDKWEPVYEKFAEYLPPESTVVTLLAHNAITVDQASALLARQGMSQELITAYLYEAHTEALSEYRGATVQTVMQAYFDLIISQDDARSILYSLHVTPEAADLLFAYSDTQRSFSQISAAVTHIRSLYIGRKITLQTARNSLETLKVPAASIDPMLQTWELENNVSVKTLTATEISQAYAYEAFTEDEAIQELVNIGYTPFDGWAILSIYKKAAQPNKPAQGPAPAYPGAIPGTT
jgi:hypothetical protein